MIETFEGKKRKEGNNKYNYAKPFRKSRSNKINVYKCLNK